MTCTDCCNQTSTCGYGVGTDPPAGTRNIGVMLLNDTNLSIVATQFAVNGHHKDSQGAQTGDTQVILQGGQFLLIGKEGFNPYQVPVSGMSYVNGRCYFMGLTIQTLPTRKIIATVTDSLGNTGTAEKTTAGDTFFIANIKMEDDINTYFFTRPTWWWETVSGCGVSAVFWSTANVFEGKQAGCTITTASKKIELVNPVKIKVGRNATSAQSCGTLLW